MKKIYVLTHSYDSDDASDYEVLAASENLHTLNAIMRDKVVVELSGALHNNVNSWDEDESEPLTDDPNQRNVSYSYWRGPADYMYETWEIVEMEVV